ncbi:MAG: metallophosphoesterase, partial [Gemmatimonadota bacterium]|nr:metallophosphoesterase [Gemmatimonadota bacterium]
MATKVARALLVLTLATAAAHAQPRPAPAPLVPHATQGTVYDDRDGNGRRDPGEPGIAGVVVSNQDEVTRTDAGGAYRMGATGFGAVFVSVPQGYRATGPFWRRADAAGSVDFGLQAAVEPSPFVFALASDTHLSEASVPRTRRLRAIVDSAAPALLLVTGDLVKDALRVGEAEAAGYYALVATEFGAFRTPLFTVPGNHENFGIERDQSHVPVTHPLYGRAMYRAYRGPDYYSFNAGGVHFVGLNSVDIADLWYYGHVDSLQLAWLRRDLAMVPEGTPVVTFNHIPFYSVSEELGGYSDTPP